MTPLNRGIGGQPREGGDVWDVLGYKSYVVLHVGGKGE